MGDADDSEYIDIQNVLLYEVDVMMGVVAEVSHDSTRFITPLAAFGVDDYNEPDDEDEDDRRRMQHEFETTNDFEPTVPFMWTTEEWDPRPSINDSSNSGMQVTGILVWPHFTVEHKVAQMNDTAVLVLELEADDVFGNGASTMFDVDNATAWNVTVGTTTWMPMSTTEMPETSEEMSSTEDLPSTSEMISTTQEDDGKTVEKLTRGLDNVPGYVWLILLGLFFLVAVGLAFGWYRSKQTVDDLLARGQGNEVGKSPYVPLNEADDRLL